MDFKNLLSGNSDALVQLGAGLLGGRTANEQLAGGLTGFAQGRKQNKTLDWLRSRDPEIAAAMESGLLDGSGAAQAYFQKQRDALKSEKPQNPYMSAGGSLFNWQTGQWTTPPAGAGVGQDEFGLNTIPGVDANGNPALMQVSKSGKSHVVPTPDGFSIQKDPIKVDAGTEWILLDPMTRQPIGKISKDLAGAAQQKALGEATGQAAVALPAYLEKVKDAKSLIDEMVVAPGREAATGTSSTFDPRNYLAGTDATDFQIKNKQLKSKVFLEAFNSLKGAGAITDVEGGKATSAIAALDLAQSDGEYLKALQSLKEVLDNGEARARAMASGNFTGGAAPTGQPAPQGAGRTSSGVSFTVEP